MTAVTFEFRPVTSDRELLQVFIETPADSDLFRSSDLALLQTIEPELARFLPGLTESVDSNTLRSFRWREGVPEAPVGVCKMVQRYRDWLQGSSTRVVLAGDYTNFYRTDGAAASGEMAAFRIARS